MRDTIVIILAAGKGSRMESDLPKVLHEVDGRPMIQHSIDKVRELNVHDIVLVVGFKQELVRDAVGDSVQYVVQEEQLGTGHAVMQASPIMEGFDGNVVILYGDMPLVNSATIRKLIEAREKKGVKGALLTIVLDNPPDFGRIIRDENGHVRNIVEVKDCSPDELALKEVNVGMYCFDCAQLLSALSELSNDNAQGEYYLTDVAGIIAQKGHFVETVSSGSLEETLGINDQHHLFFAESLKDIKYAESLYDLIDATLAMQRQK